MKKWKLSSIFVVILLLVLAACSSNDEDSANKDNNDSNLSITIQPTISEMETGGEGGKGGNAEAQKVVFEDVTFNKVPEKIVVFDFGFLDTLDAIGVEGIVGVPKDGALPENLKKYADDKYASVGSLKEPNLDEIARLKPDAIFISGRQAAFYDQLKEITPNVVFVGTSTTDYWNTFIKSTEIAGKLFGKEKEVKAEVAKIEDAINKVKELAGKYETSLVTMYNEGKLSGFGTGSRFGYVYDIYGFKPVAADIESSSHGSDFGYEQLLEFNPQVIFVVDRTAAIGGQSNIEKDLANDIVKKTDAYKNNRIIYLDGALWYLSGGGVQSELAKIEEILNELK